LEFDTYTSDVIGMESWPSEEINNAGVFRADYTTFRRDMHTGGGGIFICAKNHITCAELWVDEVHEITAVEVKRRNPKKYTGNCRLLQSSKQGLAGIKKIVRPERIFEKYHEA